MKVFSSGCRVFSARDHVFESKDGVVSYRPICRKNGAKQISLSIMPVVAGRTPVRVNETSEEVFYVTQGSGRALIGAESHEIELGTGGYIPPGSPFCFESADDSALTLVSVCCPEPGAVEGPQPDIKTNGNSAALRKLTVHEQEREAIHSGDREFKLMADKDLGCQRITQFIGTIPPSKAPFHFHGYEEAIYILEGSGLVHTEHEGKTESCAFAAGTCIYLPQAVRHCLENPGPGKVKLLGVFYPSGSPGTRYDDAQTGASRGDAEHSQQP